MGEKKGFFKRLVEGLTKTRDNIVSGIDSIFNGFSNIDDDFYEELEEILIMGDLGVHATMEVIEDLKKKVKENHIKEPADCKQFLIDSIKEQMDVGEAAYEFEDRTSVVLIIGVNGVGKTTTAINLSACLAEAGQRVLTVDFDPQGNTTSGLGLEKGNIDNTVYELLMGECTVDECINPSVQERLDVMPSDVDLAGAEIELLDMEEKESILKKNMELLDGKYDFIIIDCPPSLNLLTINALTAANTVLVPIQCEYYALEGLSQVLKTVNLVQKKLNPSLEVEGVVFTMYDSRTNLSLEVVENVKEHLNENIYKTIIPRNVRLAEAPSYGMPINLYDSRSSGAESYRLLAAEVISRGEEI